MGFSTPFGGGPVKTDSEPRQVDFQVLFKFGFEPFGKFQKAVEEEKQPFVNPFLLGITVFLAVHQYAVIVGLAAFDEVFKRDILDKTVPLPEQ